MVTVTVLIEYLFQGAGWLPRRIATTSLTSSGVRLDYTLVLTLLFLGLTVALWIVKRIGDRRLGESAQEGPAAQNPVA